MSKDFAAERRLVGALVRMPPKPHNEMKLGKAKPKLKKSLPEGRKGAQKLGKSN